MKISDICYKTPEEVDKMPRFDMVVHPQKTKWYLTPVTWALAIPEAMSCNVKICKHGMEGLEGGYIMLCNHNSFVDFKVATMAIFPRMANYVVAVDGFINRERLLRDVGCIGKRKFVADMTLVRQLKYSLNVNNYICAIYPEARYSHVGTTAILPKSLGQMVKRFNVPVVTLICHGNHLRQPVWNLHKRKLNLTADMTKLLTPEQIEKLSSDEIQNKIEKAFYYDDYEYQLQNRIEIDYEDRAKGIDKVLYMCPSCKTEGMMHSDKNRLWCEKCSKSYEMDTLGEMWADDGETEFSHIPDWYEWQRAEVRKQIERGEYKTDIEVNIDSLPNSTGYYRLGKGRLVHDETGFTLTAQLDGKDFSVHKNILDNYGVHVEYDYFGKGDCVSFSTLNDTYYLFPTQARDIVTKIHFAVEELYKIKYAEREAREKERRNEKHNHG